jgi:hypothetical protein
MSPLVRLARSFIASSRSGLYSSAISASAIPATSSCARPDVALVARAGSDRWPALPVLGRDDHGHTVVELRHKFIRLGRKRASGVTRASLGSVQPDTAIDPQRSLPPLLPCFQERMVIADCRIPPLIKGGRCRRSKRPAHRDAFPWQHLTKDSEDISIARNCGRNERV